MGGAQEGLEDSSLIIRRITILEAQCLLQASLRPRTLDCFRDEDRASALPLLIILPVLVYKIVYKYVNNKDE